jgi:F-type H+-transporting ATPase subunit b
MEKLGINLGYLLVQIFNFVILFIVLSAWVYKPLTGMLEKRRNSIAKGLEDARVAAEARANAEGEAQKILADAQAKAGQVIREASDRADLVAKDIRAQVDAEAAKAKEAALAEATEERNRMLSEVRGQVAALAIAAAQKLVGESLDEKRQHSLLQEFFSGVKSGKVVVLEGQIVKGNTVTVTSALPLLNDEKNAIQKDIVSKLGSEAATTYFVDPSILGGLVIKVGDKLIDGSVAGQLENLKQSIQ